jgi:hypothetical protein
MIDILSGVGKLDAFAVELFVKDKFFVLLISDGKMRQIKIA